MFTDIAGSLNLWKLDSAKMMEGLDRHESQILHVLEGCDAMVVKSIGDSFMLVFDKFYEAILYGIALQKHLLLNPIYVGSKSIQIRIGIRSWWGCIFLFI